jgi:hypothetical protein
MGFTGKALAFFLKQLFNSTVWVYYTIYVVTHERPIKKYAQTTPSGNRNSSFFSNLNLFRQMNSNKNCNTNKRIAYRQIATKNNVETKKKLKFHEWLSDENHKE